MVFAYNSVVVGRLAQLVEHPLDVRKVAGSSPTSSTIKLNQKRCQRKKAQKFQRLLGFFAPVFRSVTKRCQ